MISLRHIISRSERPALEQSFSASAVHRDQLAAFQNEYQSPGPTPGQFLCNLQQWLRHLHFFHISRVSQPTARVERFALAHEVPRLFTWFRMNYHFPFLRPHRAVSGIDELMHVKHSPQSLAHRTLSRGVTAIVNAIPPPPPSSWRTFSDNWLQLLLNRKILNRGSWHF